ncbi:unnamed protein product [Paramecium sonneborni]|uniref:Ubiquitin-like protease family profile domain-containing protein n=1 Tax=Paramecium sonneborni TaxID=65129 RepID=A0A8S1QEZ8_9CILI|nr:unnamed protein product [Paramecium sonneborni]
MHNKHRIVFISESTLVPPKQVPEKSQQVEPFRVNSKIQQLAQQDYDLHVRQQLEELKKFLKEKQQKFIIDYGGHDDENTQCQQNLLKQQNQNQLKSFKNDKQILPQLCTSQRFSDMVQTQKIRQKLQNCKSIQPLKNQSRKYISDFNQSSFTVDQLESLSQTEVKQSSGINKQTFKSRYQSSFPSKCQCKYKKNDSIIKQSNNKVVMNLQMFQIDFIHKNEKKIRKTVYCQSDFEDNKDEKKLKKQQTFPFIKLNQQIGKQEDQLLNQTGKFWTSSMIDAYANYLNGNDEKYYFSLSKQQRQCHQRLYIFTSDFITNCSLGSNPSKEKLLLLILEKLEYFKKIQYQFWIIYQKIVFVVNQNNIHWYLVTVDLNERFIYVYDSLLGDKYHYQQVKELLTFFFMNFRRINQMNNKKKNFNSNLSKREILKNKMMVILVDTLLVLLLNIQVTQIKIKIIKRSIKLKKFQNKFYYTELQRKRKINDFQYDQNYNYLFNNN